jgi:hypothetical protein
LETGVEVHAGTADPERLWAIQTGKRYQGSGLAQKFAIIPKAQLTGYPQLTDEFAQITNRTPVNW